jgi:hypothetical protein
MKRCIGLKRSNTATTRTAGWSFDAVWTLALTLLGGAMIGGAIGDIRSTRRYGTKLFLQQDQVYRDARAIIDAVVK